MHFDDVLRYIGEFGPYQKRLYFLLVFPCIFGAIQTMGPIFIFGDQSYRCILPTGSKELQYDSENMTLAEESVYDGSATNLKPFYNILDNATDVTAAKCKLKIYNKHENTSISSACNTWRYDKSIYTSTVVSQFNLVCNSAFLQSHAKMAYFGGCLAASCIGGTLGDMFGRRPVYVVFLLLMFASSISLPWAPNITVFIILRFVIGFADLGFLITAVVIGLEIVSPSKRIWTGMVLELVFCVGEFILCGAAYFIRDWKTLQIVLSAPSAIVFISIFLIPESPRWLLSKGKHKQAMKIVKTMAKSTNKELPENLVIDLEEDEKFSFGKTILPIFKSKVLVYRFIIITLSWFVISMTYYGITYNVGKIGGDVYLNFFLSTVVEFIAYSAVIFLSERLGRKPVHCGGLLIAGIACIATIFTTLYAKHSLLWITIALSMVGKFFVSAAFGNIFLYTTELFPTGVRSFALGTTNMGARIGSMVSPYIADLGNFTETDIGKALPLTIFGVSAAIVGLLSLIIPETLNTKLPENISEATNFPRYIKSTHGNKEVNGLNLSVMKDKVKDDVK